VVMFDSNAQTLFDRGTSLGNEVYLKSFNGKDHGFWWDTNEFYTGLLEQVIGDVLLFSR